MFGGKLLWTGLTLVTCASLLPIPQVVVVGQVIMVIGVVLLWLDK